MNIVPTSGASARSTAAAPAASLRIEMLVPSLIAAGMEVMVADLCRRLRERGHRLGVTCLLGEGALSRELAREGIPVRHVDPGGRLGNAYPVELARELRASQLDVVHIHSGIWLKAARAARLARVRQVVFTAHGLPEPDTMVSTIIGNVAARFTDVAVGVSESVCGFLIERARLPRRKVTLIRNGIDTTQFRPDGGHTTLREEIGASETDCVIGIVARLAPIKDHATLLEAFAITAATRPHARLAIVGDGPLRKVLESQVRSLGLANQVAFLGIRRDMAGVYRDLDIVALSSTSEGTSLSLLEGLASGRACVATAVGGNVDVLNGGTVGLLVPPRKPLQLAAALGDLVDHPSKRVQLGRNGRAWVEARYGQEAMTDAYEALYRVGTGSATINPGLA